jgi:hypothetical protein
LPRAAYLRLWSAIAMSTASTVNQRAVTGRAFHVGDEPEVLDVLVRAFGEWPRDVPGVTPAEFLRWKHTESPFGPSRMLVAEREGAVVGFGADMRWQLRTGDRVVAAVRGVDLAVLPEYRGMGVSMAVRGAAQYPSDAALFWSNPNAAARVGDRKAGKRQGVEVLADFLRPSRPARTIGRRLASASRTPARVIVEAPPVAELLDDPAWMTLLASSAPPGEQLMTARTPAYMRWRYRHDSYRAVRVESGGATRAAAVFRCRRHGSFWVSHICELLVDERDHRSVARLLGEVRDAAPADFLRCSFRSRVQAVRHGFVHPRRRGCALTVHPLREELLPDPTLARSWSLSIGDLELL